METEIKNAAKDKMLLVDAQVTYPAFGLRIILASPKRNPMQLQTQYMIADLMINSTYQSQQAAAQKSLKSLLDTLNVQLPELALHQPKQVVAASYARALQKWSWNGSLFTKPQSQLPLINVTTQDGTSKHRHKHYTNYTFSATEENVNRDDTQIEYTPADGWWYYAFLNQTPLDKLPEDFLLWFDSNKRDRGDKVDATLLAKSLNMCGKKLQALFYQIKFELADVISLQPYRGYLPANLPANLFQRDIVPHHSLTGLMIKYYRQYGHRPDVKQIYWTAVKNQLPNQAWNGKWVSNKQ